MLNTLLAADFGGVVAAVIGLISIGAAIVNAMNEKKQPPRRNRPKDNSKVRREIEEFLEQQSGGKKSSRRDEVITDDIEIVEEPRPRPAPRPAPKPKKAVPPQRPQPASQKPVPPSQRPPTPAPSARPGDRPIGSPNLGTALREHVSQAMHERVAAQAQRDLPHLANRVDEEVKQDLGTFSVSGKKAAPASSMPLVKMLRNPQSARNAVIIAEVLGRPKALRK